MCKHEEIVTASRNAVVALRTGLRGMAVSPEVNLRINEEFSRRENAYDSLLEGLKKQGCKSCEADRRNIFRKSDYLRFVDEYVEHYGK